MLQGGIYLCGKHKEKKEIKAQEEARKKMANKSKAAIPPIEDAPPRPQPMAVDEGETVDVEETA